MFLKNKELKSVEELAGNFKYDAQKHRNENPILVIDDTPFARTDSLNRNGFRVTEINDLNPLSTVNGYSIVCCDIDGVGRALGFQDGAELMKEIKRCYPMKTVIAFSNKDSSMLRLKKLKVVDEWFDKDVAFEDWVERLDSQVEQLVDPYKQWKRARTKLLERGVSIHIVAALENEFVISFRNNQLQEFAKSKLIDNLSTELKPIIQGLVSNLIFKMLGG